MERPISPDRMDVLQAWLEQRALETHTALPGRVERYDAATQTADVLPLIRGQVPRADGSTDYEDLPVIPSVPVMFPRVGAWFVSLPVAAGDTVLLVFCEAAIGHWWAGDGAPQYPGDLRRHHLSHAVAVPGLFVRSRALAHASATDMVIGSDEAGGARIALKPNGEIHMAGEAGGSVALANAVASQLTALKNAIAAWTPVPNDGGAALKAALTALFAAWPGSVAATKVKAT